MNGHSYVCEQVDEIIVSNYEVDKDTGNILMEFIFLPGNATGTVHTPGPAQSSLDSYLKLLTYVTPPLQSSSARRFFDGNLFLRNIWIFRDKSFLPRSTAVYQCAANPVVFKASCSSSDGFLGLGISDTAAAIVLAAILMAACLILVVLYFKFFRKKDLRSEAQKQRDKERDLKEGAALHQAKAADAEKAAIKEEKERIKALPDERRQVCACFLFWSAIYSIALLPVLFFFLF